MDPDTSPSVVILSQTRTDADPRVTRQARAFSDAGWLVTTVGLGPFTRRPDNHHHIEIRPLEPYENAPDALDSPPLGAKLFGVMSRTLRPVLPGLSDLARKASARLGRGQSLWGRAAHYGRLVAGLRVNPQAWPDVYWPHHPLSERMVDSVMQNPGSARPETYDLIVANDWECLPVAERLRERIGGRVWYDSHEFATDEFSGQRRFRIWHRPLILAVESALIGQADMVSTVSDGLAAALEKQYDLTRTPLTIRNLPVYREVAWRSSDTQALRVLYQGVIARGRGLEALVDSVELWPASLSLTLRGPVHDPAYGSSLAARIAASPRCEDIHLVGPVPFDALVEAASDFDIGIMALPDGSTHNEYALPNKVFEYLMAGLAILVTRQPEMARVVSVTKAGGVITDLTPEAIAGSIQEIVGQNLDDMRKRALDAAKQLNWESESAKMIEHATRVVADSRRVG